jgi:hypothetical protein
VRLTLPRPNTRNTPIPRGLLLGVVAGLALLGGALSGCGGGSDAPSASGSDPDQIRQVVDRFNAAASGPDAEILCGEVLPPSSLHATADECAQKLGQVMKQNPQDWKPITDVSHIKVEGDGATATVAKAVGQPFEATFAREDGHWYMQVFD